MLDKINTKKGYNIATIIILIITVVFMFYWIGKKEGFHEDEIFTYGSSNYKWDNVFQAAGKSDFLNRTIEKYVIGDSLGETLENISYYLKHQDEFGKLAGEIHSGDKPVWKTAEDAKEYVTIGNGDVLNYFSVYYNQSRDVHPPLFYMLVHLASSIAYGVFSKYIIFAINLIFFILSFMVIKKIFELFNKKWLGLIALLLYGFSMGAVSTVIFLRMYMMITFFGLAYLYINLKILKNNLQITKKEKWQLFWTILLGFLTQYYFCILVFGIFILMFIRFIQKKEYKMLKKYIIIHIVSALVGIILFPVAIYHIFFSYRGVNLIGNERSFLQTLVFYIERICEAYSINNIFVYAVIALGIVGVIARLIIIKKNKKSIKNLYGYLIIIIPTLIYLLIVTKMAPDIEAKYAMRYIMPILPELAIIFALGVVQIFKNKKIAYGITLVLVLVITVNGIITNEPKYLYKGYSKYMEIAEQYKDLDLVYAVDNAFTHMTSMPEFLTYNKSLIINMNYDKLDFLKTDEELQSQDQFILTIKKWMNVEDTLNKILEYSGFSNYEVLLQQEDDTGSIIYLVSR